MGFSRLGSRSRPSITLDGLERWAELTEYRLTPEPSESYGITDPFPDSDWWLRGAAFQSLDSGSLYRFARNYSGRQVAFTVRPCGNVTPTANAPHYRGTLTVGPKPELGGAASDPVFVFEFAWLVSGEPEEVTA